MESVFDCLCYLSSDEFTGEVLRSLGHNAPTGLLHEMCLQEASNAGPAAAARLNYPSCQGNISGASSLLPDEKTMKAAIAEGRKGLGSALNGFFTQLTDMLVNVFLDKQKRQGMGNESTSEAGFWRPLRVLVAVDRNHPPNAVSSRFSEVEDLLQALQSAVLVRCGVLVKVATAALLLPPGAAQDGSSVHLGLPLGQPKAQDTTWDFPWSIEVVLRCMYRVLCRGDHATLAGGRRGISSLEGLSEGASDSCSTQDVKALHICLSFLSCFKGYSKIYDFLRMHPNVTHVLQLQTVLPVQNQKQNNYQQKQQQMHNQQRLLLAALSSLKPFSDLPKDHRVYSDLATSLREFPPEGPLFGEFRAHQRASISCCAGELLHHVDCLFSSMEEPLLHRRDQLLQQQLQQQQPQQQHECQGQRFHEEVDRGGRLQQHQGDLGQVAPEEGRMASLQAVRLPTADVVLRLPTYFSIFLGDEKEALTSLTQQLLAAVENAEGAEVPSVVDMGKSLKPVDSPHITTFFMGGGTLEANQGEIDAANEWLDEQFRTTSTENMSCLDSTSKGTSAYCTVCPRILRLYELLASRRQVSRRFKFQVTHLLLTDIGLACAALTPLSPVLPLAEPTPSQTSSSNVCKGGNTFFGESASGYQVDGPVITSQVAAAREIDADVGNCGPSCAVSGPHKVYMAASDLQPLCMAGYHYAHVTLGLAGDAKAVMSNNVIAAADKAILQGTSEKKLRADTPRPFRTGAPRNKGVGEDQPTSPAAGDAYQDLNCYSVGGSDDAQELIAFTGVPVSGRRARLWVWSLPKEVQEELEGPVQAR